MKTKLVTVFFILLWLPNVSHSASPTVKCKAKQLAAAGALCSSLLACESAYVIKANSKAKRTACINKAQSKFNKTYSKAINQGHGSCTFQANGLSVAAEWTTAINGSGSLAETILTGWDANSAQINKLYSNLLSAAAAQCASSLVAHGGNAIKSNEKKLSTALNKARNKFLASTAAKIKKIEAKGIDYVGNEGVVIADKTKAVIDNIVAQTGGMNTGGGNGGGSASKLKATQIVAGGSHLCTLMENGKVKCWGYLPGGGSYPGVLGVGGAKFEWDPSKQKWQSDNAGIPPLLDLGTILKVVQLSAGSDHTCARFENGQVKCWGRNDNGQLGLGDTAWRGDESGEMGANLAFIDLGTGRTAVKVVAGAASTCALLDNGKVKCWGEITGHMSGLGYPKAYGDQALEMGDNLPELAMGSQTATDLMGGANTFCVKVSAGPVKCWGNNGIGELGSDSFDEFIGDNQRAGGLTQLEDFEHLPTLDLGIGVLIQDAYFDSYQSLYANSCALANDGSLSCYSFISGIGYGWHPINLGTAIKVASLKPNKSGLYRFQCASLTTGQIKCWGDGGTFLGLGTTAPYNSEIDMGDFLPTVDLGSGRTVLDYAQGNSFTCAVLDNGLVKCWGGWSSTVGDEPGEMGDNLIPVDLGTN